MKKEKTALVTGASRGIGKAIAERLAKEGIRTVLCSRHIDDRKRFELYPGCACAAYACDVSDAEQVEEMTAHIRQQFGRVDILVNAAGISPKDKKGMKIPCFAHTLQMWDQVMQVNLNGAFYVSRAVVGDMMESGWGRIINISSIVGMTSSEHGPACAAYVASKTGLIGLTRAMAYDLAPYGITVNAVAPGRIQTQMSEANDSSYNELHHKLIPMHRFGTPQEVAEACMFLASEQSSYITGETVNLTGGWFL